MPVTTEITILERNASQIIDIVLEMRKQGYVQGRDFDFAYHQIRWDEMIGEIPTSAIFTFYEDALASWFAIKYS
jgi:hypothetical protein